MTATTPRVGIIYPTPTDPVTNYPATAAAAATTIDTALSKVLAGVVTVAATNAAQSNAVTVTFPAGRFTGTPVVVAHVYGTSLWIAGTANLTATSVQLYAHTKTGATSTSATIYVNWIALPTRTTLVALDGGPEDDLELLEDDDGG